VYAADLPVRVPAARPIYVPAVYNWTGFYIGRNLGGDFSNISLTDMNNNTFSSSLSGAFLGGGQAGVNYEVGGGVVIGAEAMFDWIPITKDTITALNGTSTAAVSINNRWLMLATGRLGYAWDRTAPFPVTGDSIAFNGSNTVNVLFTAGLNYKFGPW
jgi:outer membrane immunogenic protein